MRKAPEIGYFCGAAGQIRTADLILTKNGELQSTNSILYISYIFPHFGIQTWPFPVYKIHCFYGAVPKVFPKCISLIILGTAPPSNSSRSDREPFEGIHWRNLPSSGNEVFPETLGAVPCQSKIRSCPFFKPDDAALFKRTHSRMDSAV